MFSARKILLPLVAMAACGVFSLMAQPFSAGLDDNNNPYDAPIPGFVGSGGEGRVDLPAYPLPAGETRVNPLFVSWADSVVDYSPATGVHTNGNPIVDPYWQFSGEALGPVTGDNFAVVSLGDLDAAAIAADLQPGSLTVSFATPIRNYTGADFAIFENGFLSLYNTGGHGVNGVFAELAYVEVSSDGVHFARFPSISLTEDLVGGYGSIDPTQVFNLAGKHVNSYGDSWGTPFDLEDLREHPMVLDGLLDLDAVSHIRIVDIPGSGDFLDSQGNPIYDAWVTWGSGGADIEAIGAIGQPQSYAQWAVNQGIANTDPLYDSDGDGWVHFAEYALGLDPHKADGHGRIRMEMGTNGSRFFVFPRDERNTDAIYIVEAQEASLSSTGWTEVARFGPFGDSQLDAAVIESVAIARAARQASVGVLQDVRLKIAGTAFSANAVFMRLRIEPVP
jgi:hypothetical protein